MAGSFSGHLVDTFLSAQQQARGPFGQNANSDIVTYGPMAFAPSMHGTFGTSLPQPSTLFNTDPILMSVSEETAKRIATLQAKLNKKLGPEFVSQRPGPGGGPKLTYAEGWKIINLANEVFGFNGWSSSVVNLSTDFMDRLDESNRYNVGVSAIVRVTLRDGVFHEDVGYGHIENCKGKGQALDKCKKEAVTDGVKRALRNFGNLLGNCLYDRQYTNEIVKIKVPPSKFDRSDLYRRPEFDENRNNASSSTAADASTSSSTNGPSAGPSRTTNPPPQTSNTSVPPVSHTRATAMAATASSNAKSPMGLAGQHNSTTSSIAPQAPLSKPASTSSVVFQASVNEPAQPQQLSSSSITSDKRVSFAQPQSVASSSSSVAAVVPVARALTPPETVPLAKVEPFDDDESYGLNSEDDAYFAAMDLGEDFGPPIHFDGNGAADVSYDDGPSVLGGYRAPTKPAEPSRPPQPQPAGLSNRNGTASNAGQHPTAGVQPQPQQQRLRPSEVLQREFARSGASAASKPPSARPTSSQMGGFHFPPEVNARPGTNHAGVKRSADALRESTTARRPAQGMGLSHAPPGAANAGRREPLAALDVGDGGDVKRVKR